MRSRRAGAEFFGSWCSSRWRRGSVSRAEQVLIPVCGGDSCRLTRGVAGLTKATSES